MLTKARSLCGVIYPDDPNFNQYLEFIKKQTYFYCLHDRSLEDDNLTLKKPHIHFLVKYENPISIDGFCKKMGLPQNYIEPCSNPKSYVRYLIHADDLAKEPYKIEEIKTNDYLFRAKCFDNLSKENFMVKFLLYIQNSESRIIFADVLTWALNKGYFDEYKKNYSLIRDIINQENERKLTHYTAKEVAYVGDEEEIPF